MSTRRLIRARSAGLRVGAGLALLAALVLAGCGEKKAADTIEPAADPGDVDAIRIESEDDALERARKEIDLENWEESLKALEGEIDSLPFARDDG